MMERQHRLRIAAIFEEAMDLRPEDQARFMDIVCGSDMELRREVQRLLDADVTEQPRAAFHPIELESGVAIGDAASPDTRAVNDAATAVTLGTQPEQRAITIGTRIGSYRIVEQLAKGGMGAVFLARHETLGHDAVVKVLLPYGWQRCPSWVPRFEREAQMAAAIRHPGVVQVMDSGRHESGDRFILMERLHGESLRDRLLSVRKLSPHTAVSFALQTARTLEAVHVHCVHRDLKPDNLFLVPEPEVPGGERVKILDFGIAKPRKPLNKFTPNLTTMGTPPYMAPEQYLDAASVDDRADLYSMGVVLFQMLCGRLPFQCQSVDEYRDAHALRTPPPVECYAQVSPGLSDVVARLLAKKRRDRFQSARALVEALEVLPEIQSASDTEPQAMAPETVGPVHEPACLPIMETAPAITVAPDIIVAATSRMPRARTTKRMWGT